MSLILDNSIAMAWCFRDERTAATVALLDRVTASGAVAPWLWPLEASNALLMAERRGRITGDERRTLAGFLRDLPIVMDAESVSHIWTTTVRLAERHRLTVYDAMYLELAQRRNLPLATLDSDLRAAANALGVPLLGT
ncbi:MAG: type II toxin-antitoxin system VapC family toxin [Chloroflexi bacterium]|nr:type II toxin-antitoxin system VapC family toxin [Chloroflexota bacterium]